MKKLLILILLLAAVLRVWKLDAVPPSLFGDEVDVGYHAYSILKTGQDYTGNLAVFYVNSIADKKAPLYAYLTVPSIAMFGVTPAGVRLPAAILGVVGVLLIYHLVVKLSESRSMGLISALLFAISPWHIQFSRWGLEHTLMLSLFLAGVYFLLKSFSKNMYLVISSICFSLTLYAYHAAKIFLPLILIVMFILWWKELKKISKGYLIISSVIAILAAGPIMISSILGNSAERFGSLSIFNNPKNIGEIGFGRVRDIQTGSNFGRLFHNKVTLLFDKIENNYLESFSTQFLFLRGDVNLRHSVLQNGQFYKYQLFFLILGLVFLARIQKRKYKLFMISWLILAPFPGMVTTGGGEHAARLFFMLPPLIVIIAIGIYESFTFFSKKLQTIYILTVGLIIFLSLLFYQHNYWIHYPWDSQKWWQAGFKEAIQAVVSEGKNYDKVIISQADEPALIFFLGFSQYPPDQFHKRYPLISEDVPGFGSISKLDEFYFPPIGQGIDLYSLGSVLPPDTLYLATIKEINLDLIREPERVPKDIRLIKSITYPSGEPAFYLFTLNVAFK